MLSQGKKGQWIAVGYDMRFSSEHFAATVAEVLAGNGLKVYLTDSATPTPEPTITPTATTEPTLETTPTP